MSEEDGEKYEFVCPKCGESLEVNDAMMRVLLERGCVICGSPVTGTAFSPNSPAETS